MKMHLSGSRARRGTKSRSSQLNDRNLGRVVQRILEIEALETRLLLSGIGTGLGKKKVSFTDAAGDKVTVSVSGHDTFDIALLGGTTNNSDVNSILLHGGDAKSALSIVVTPVKLHGGVNGVQGWTMSTGVMIVDEIDAAAGLTTLAGISSAGAALDNLNLSGVAVGGINLTSGRATYSDRINTNSAGFTNTYIPQADQVDFGAITAGSIGTLSITGPTPGGASAFGTGTNDFNGPITVTGSIGKILGLNSSLTGSVTAGSVSNVTVGFLGNTLTSLGAGDLTINAFKGIGAGAIITAGGNVHFNSTNGGFLGTIDAVGNITGLNNGGIVINGGLYGTLHSSGGNISNITINGGSFGVAGSIVTDTGTIGNITLASSGQYFNGIVHAAGTGNAGQLAIGNITATGTSFITGATIIANSGNIGAISADHITGTTINAVTGNITSIAAHSATANAINLGTVHAGGNIGPITAQSDAQGGRAINGTIFRADGNFTGAITATVTGGSTAVAINNATFSTAGDFQQAITASAATPGGPAGTGDAIKGGIFSAKGSFLGGITANGNINGGLFLAGYDIGANGVVNGTTGPTDDVMSATTATPTFTSIVVNNGNVLGATFASGVNPIDTTFGNGNDVLNATGATIGTLTVSGKTINSIMESGSIPAISGNQAFLGNTVIAFQGNIDGITIVGAFPGTAAFAGNTVTATQGSIGNILIHNTSSTGTDAMGMYGGYGNYLTAKLGVGDIVGITDGTGHGIDHLYINADSSGTGVGSVGSIVGVATNSNGIGNGINVLSVNGANRAVNIGTAISPTAATFLTNNLPTTGAITGATVSAAVGAGGIVGITAGNKITGGKTTYGIFNAYLSALTGGSIGNIFGQTTNASATYAYGIRKLGAYANQGGSIGNITGSAIATRGAHGIAYSTISADVNLGAVSGTGKAYAGNLGSASAYGIGDNSGFNNVYLTAGAAGGTVTVGAISGTAVATSASGAVTAYGIHTGTVGGANTLLSAQGVTNTIGAITGTATATTTKAGSGATAYGITGANWLAKANSHTNTTGTLTSITGTAVANGTTGATAFGLNGVQVTLGAGTGAGTIGLINGSGKANAVSTATGVNANAYARGINGGSFATYGATGKIATGATDSITGYASAIASADGNADAYGRGITGQFGTQMDFYADKLGTNGAIGAINGTGLAQATSTGTGTSYANGRGINRMNASAGTTTIGTADGTGSIGNITAVGNAVASSPGASKAYAYGIRSSNVVAGAYGANKNGVATIGDISATVFASANSATKAATVMSYGLRNGTFTAAGSQTGTIGKITVQGGGTIGATTGVAAYATTAGAAFNATANSVFGIYKTTFNAANGTASATVVPVGTIGGSGISVTTISIAQNTSATATGFAKAYAGGIYGGFGSHLFTAGNSTTGGTGNIGATDATHLSNITIDAEATATNATATAGKAYSSAVGLSTYFYAGTGSTAAGKPGTGNIGNITATAKATTNVLAATTGKNSANATAINYGVYAGSQTAGTTGVGTIGFITANATATTTATALNGGTNTALGFNAVNIYAGTMDGTAAGAGQIGKITGSAISSGIATSEAIGILNTTVLAATGIGGIEGDSAGAATVGKAMGISGSQFVADGGTAGLTGSLGDIKATTAATGENAILNSLFSSIQAIGAINVTGSVSGSQFVAGDSYAVLGAPDGGRYNTTSAASIGTVIISNKLISSDIVAGEKANDGRFGNAGDTVAFAGSTIGAVTIGNGIAGAHAAAAGGGLPLHAIEAGGGAFSTTGVRVGTNAVFTPQVGFPGTDFDSDLSGAITATDVVVVLL
ncbi:MAG: hypothetical protein ABSH21_10065 [Verrucomicrobiia bacterium]|jgi:hypothetical protein